MQQSEAYKDMDKVLEVLKARELKIEEKARGNEALFARNVGKRAVTDPATSVVRKAIRPGLLVQTRQPKRTKRRKRRLQERLEERPTMIQTGSERTTASPRTSRVSKAGHWNPNLTRRGNHVRLATSLNSDDEGDPLSDTLFYMPPV